MIKSVNTRIKNEYLYFAALIGIGFLWTGTAYMMQVYRMLGFLDGGTVNLLACGAYYVCQAAGIGIVSLLFAKNIALAGGRTLPLFTSVTALICTAASLFIPSLAVITTAGALLNISIGVLSGCYLTRLSTNIPQMHRGLVFGIAYAFGSIGTWLISMPMGGRFLWHAESFFAIAALAAVSLLLLRHLSPPPAVEGNGCGRTGLDTKTIWLAAAVLILLSMESMLGFSFPSQSAATGGVKIEFTRIFYSAGLIIAGLVSDKSRRWGAICCLTSLAFPFAALALGSSVTGETIMWIMAYLFLGFISVHRILTFSDISGKSGLPSFAVLGLLAGRLGEAAGTLGTNIFTGTPLVVLSSLGFALVIGLFFLLYHKLYNTAVNPEEAENRKQLEYMSRFSLSPREQEIFRLIIQGMSNMEIAGALYITESTVKFHTGNIFKKTGISSRLELISDYKLSGNN
jgi:DNA-binding CsgD family transcriptional regulator/MFS family permease